MFRVLPLSYSSSFAIRIARTAVAAGTLAGLAVLGACADATKTVSAPLQGPRNSTIQSGGRANAATVKLCVDASSPAGAYRFTNSGFLSGYKTGINNAVQDGADGGSGVTNENVADGTSYPVAVGPGGCVTVLTRTTPDGGFPGSLSCPALGAPGCTGFPDTWSGITVTATTIPGGVAYDHTDCLLDQSVKAAIPNPCGTGNNPTRAYANTDHGTAVTFFFTQSTQSNGVIAPTQTTCEMYASGTAATEPGIFAGVKGSKIGNVSPGVFFYYATVTKAAGQPVGFDQTVSSPIAGFPKYAVHQGQAYLYTFNGSTCTNVLTFTLGLDSTSGSGGASLGTGTYILGIKFNPSNAIGTNVPSALRTSGSLLATHAYQASVNGVGQATTNASINTNTK